MNEQYCQATKNKPATTIVPSQSPDGPYYLCAAAAERLENFALRPLEWFHLAAIHGPFEYYLHDDFYTEEGEATQPTCEVDAPDRFPCPTLQGCAGDLEHLLDFAITRWHLRPPVVQALSSHSPELLDVVSQRYAQTQNGWRQVRFVEIAAAVIGQGAKVWFGGILRDLGPEERIELLHFGHPCLPREKGLHAALSTLAQLPPPKLAGSCLVLAHFRDAAVLDWIEANVADPLTHQWGDVAAASGLDWNRIAAWLQKGRPLSLIALDAMVACGGPHAGHAKFIERMRPTIRARAPFSKIEATLREHSAGDHSPRASRAVQYILKNLQVIIEPA